MTVTNSREFNGTLRLSNSKVGTYRRCPKKFEFKYEMGLRSKYKALPLERGSWLHALLEAYYNGDDWRVVHKKYTQEFNKLFDEEKEDLGNLPVEVLRIFTSYLQRYAKQDSKLKVIDVELDEIITLPNGLRFQIIIDLIVEEPDGGLWIWDHKTVGRFMPEDFMLLDAQLARYFWGAEHMGYTPLRGIMFNEINTTPPTLPKVLLNGELEKRANLACDVYTYYREIKRHGAPLDPHRAFLRKLKAQEGRWFRRTHLPKDPPLVNRLMDELNMSAREIERAQRNNDFPRTVLKECVWDCEFKTICQIDLMGGDISHEMKSKFTQRKKEPDL